MSGRRAAEAGQFGPSTALQVSRVPARTFTCRDLVLPPRRTCTSYLPDSTENSRGGAP